MGGAPDHFFQTIDRDVKNDSHAIFGQANYDLNDDLTLTVGIRYTESNKEFDLVTTRRVGGPNVQSGKLTTYEATPLVSLTWDVNNDVMLYATYSEGYRDGSFAARFTGVVPESAT